MPLLNNLRRITSPFEDWAHNSEIIFPYDGAKAGARQAFYAGFQRGRKEMAKGAREDALENACEVECPRCRERGLSIQGSPDEPYIHPDNDDESCDAWRIRALMIR